MEGRIFAFNSFNSNFLIFFLELKLYYNHSIYFTVSDNTGNTVTEQEFNILVLAVDDQPPTVPTSGVRLNVERGSSVLISDDVISVSDVDTAPEDLQFSLLTQPSRGDIVKLSDEFHTVLREGVWSFIYLHFICT